MASLMVDFIISLDGYAGADGWPGYWGMEGPEYLAWIKGGAENQHTALLGATTYRLMSGFANEMPDEPSLAALTAMPKVVFSSTLEAPLSWANTELVDGGRRRNCAGHEAARVATPAHNRQPQSVPIAAQSRRGGPLPCGCLPSNHRHHGEGPHLRRVSRHRPRLGRQPHVRRSAPAARVRSHGARWAAWRRRLVDVLDQGGW